MSEAEVIDDFDVNPFSGRNRWRTRYHMERRTSILSILYHRCIDFVQSISTKWLKAFHLEAG